MHEFFRELKHYNMTSWDVDSVYKLMSNLTDLHIKEFDDFNIALSMMLGEMIRHWRPESSRTAELFLRLSMRSLINNYCTRGVGYEMLSSASLAIHLSNPTKTQLE